MRDNAGLRPWWALDSDVPSLGDCSNPSTTGSSEQKRSMGMPIEVFFLTNSASGLRIMPGGSRSGMFPMPSSAAFRRFSARCRPLESCVITNSILLLQQLLKPFHFSKTIEGPQNSLRPEAATGVL